MIRVVPVTKTFPMEEYLIYQAKISFTFVRTSEICDSTAAKSSCSSTENQTAARELYESFRWPHSEPYYRYPTIDLNKFISKVSLLLNGVPSISYFGQICGILLTLTLNRILMPMMHR